jgi:hypothetical protein
MRVFSAPIEEFQRKLLTNDLFRELDHRYLYLRILEQGGKDNPKGDGDDSDGDGNRDDLDDSAWTSPIWFGTAPAGTFVWSINSSVYHDANCWAVKSIGAANRREGPAPDGKTKHNCHP